jgi:hypothetical protein
MRFDHRLGLSSNLERTSSLLSPHHRVALLVPSSRVPATSAASHAAIRLLSASTCAGAISTAFATMTADANKQKPETTTTANSRLIVSFHRHLGHEVTLESIKAPSRARFATIHFCER